MKKVLIISYYFPPSGGAGVQRVLKFVKYLPDYGWEPVVLTVQESAGFPAQDASLLQEIPDQIRVIRTRIFEPYEAYRKFTGKSTPQGMDIATLGQSGGSFKDRFAEWIRATFFIPDARCFWKRTAIRAGKRLLKTEKFDIVFSSAPPYTTHLIGMALARYSDVPWIADFRDSWVGWLSTPKRWWLPYQIDLKMEKSVLNDADQITHVSNGVKADLLSRHPEISENKWALLPNGFDQADFEGLNDKPPENRFIITYTGSLYGHRNPQIFLKALHKLLEEHPDCKDQILIRFVGRVDPKFLEAFEVFGSIIEHIPYVTHNESIRYLLQSNLLLLIIDNAPASKSIITGKLYEYIGARRPILAIAPEGEAAEIIQELGVGKVFRPTDDRKTINEISKWIIGQMRHPFNLNKIATDQYERKALTRSLVAILDHFVS